jgi:hypothetical protein
MTTQAFAARMGPTIKALAAVKTKHCAPPTYRPAGPVSGHMACPRCGSRLSYTVDADGLSSGRCVAAGCVRWSLT